MNKRKGLDGVHDHNIVEKLIWNYIPRRWNFFTRTGQLNHNLRYKYESECSARRSQYSLQWWRILLTKTFYQYLWIISTSQMMSWLTFIMCNWKKSHQSHKYKLRYMLVAYVLVGVSIAFFRQTNNSNQIELLCIKNL